MEWEAEDVLFVLVVYMSPEEYAKSIGIEYKDHYPGLECPNCSKWGIMLDENSKGECKNCRTPFCEDDICAECNTLIKGSCYYCKMD